jgi:1-acyl-sn-glycerol-3-phosphate acyltransferase
LFGIDIKCTQKPFIPAGPFILAANHSSHVDTIAILSSLPSMVRKRTFVAAAKDYFFNNFRFAWARYLFNLIPTDRHGGLLSLRKTVSSVIEKNGAILMFPEGTRSRDGKIHPFKQGLGYVASTLNIPVLPVYISGGRAIMNASQYFPCSGNITVHFGTIMYPDRSDPEMFTLDVEHKIRDIQNQLNIKCYIEL